MHAKSFKENSTEEIESGLNQSMAVGFQPTLAFVFISIKQDYDDVSALLDSSGNSVFK